MNDPQEAYRQWAEKQAAMGRTVAPTTAPQFNLPTKIEATITDGPDPDAPVPDPSIRILGLAEKAPKLYDELFAKFIELTDSTPGNWARTSVGSWQNQITGTIFTVSLG